VDAASLSDIRASIFSCEALLIPEGLSAPVPRRSTARRPKPAKFLPSDEPLRLPIRYAAACNAVAAADLRAMFALAVASFIAQSGRTLSVVITMGELAEIEVVLRRFAVSEMSVRPENEPRDEDEDIADVAFASG